MRLGILLFLSSLPLLAGTLPSGVSNSEFDRIVEVLGYGSVTRLMRSAESYESFPGVKLGVEFALTPTRDINSMGDATGTLPGMVIAPRIFIAKGLFENAELVFSFFTNKFFDTLVTFGSIFKYTFYSERQSWVSAALFVGDTGSSGFTNTFKSNNI